MRRSTAALALLLAATTLTAVHAVQQRRDALAPAAHGSASLTGTVVTGGRQRLPLRRVKVTISSTELEFVRTAISDDDGGFAFEGLPPGRYRVTTARDGYVMSGIGTQRRLRPASVELTAGRTSQVELHMVKGAVITGRVLEPDGEPAVGVSVTALEYRRSGPFGERRLTTSGLPPVVTDDRGEYRLFGLPPGTYYVRAQPRLPGVAGGGGLLVLTESEIREALADVRTASTSPRPGMPPPPSIRPPIDLTNRPAITLAPIYYPGTSMAGRAGALALDAEEVRTGADIDLARVPVSTIEGSVSAPPGGGRISVMLSDAEAGSPEPLRSTAVAADGSFVFRAVPPGSYSITARLLPTPGASSGSWGRTQVIIHGEDLSGVSVAMQPGLTISGIVRFESDTIPPPALGTFRLPQMAGRHATFGTAALFPAVDIDGDRFHATGLVPGIYRFTAPLQGIRRSIGPWWLKSIRVGGRELLDGELDLQESAGDAVVTFSDRASTLAGTATYASGLAVRDERVVVFSTDPRTWFRGSRYVAVAYPDAAGKYVVRNLPAGDYFVALSDDLLANDIIDPELLEELRHEATRTTIVDAETTVLNVRPAR